MIFGSKICLTSYQKLKCSFKFFEEYFLDFKSKRLEDLNLLRHMFKLFTKIAMPFVILKCL